MKVLEIKTKYYIFFVKIDSLSFELYYKSAEAKPDCCVMTDLTNSEDESVLSCDLKNTTLHHEMYLICTLAKTSVNQQKNSIGTNQPTTNRYNTSRHWSVESAHMRRSIHAQAST